MNLPIPTDDEIAEFKRLYDRRPPGFRLLYPGTYGPYGIRRETGGE